MWSKALFANAVQVQLWEPAPVCIVDPTKSSQPSHRTVHITIADATHTAATATDDPSMHFGLAAVVVSTTTGVGIRMLVGWLRT